MKNNYEDVRGKAAQALQELGWEPENQKEKIIYLIANQRTSELKKFGNSALEPLISALRNKSYEGKEWIVEVSGQIGRTRSVEPIIEALKDKNYEGKEWIVKALGQTGRTRSVEPIIEALKNDLYGTFEESFQINAADALGNIGDKRAVGPLKALSNYTTHSYVKEAADRAIKKIYVKEAADRAIKKITGEENEGCYIVTATMGTCNHPTVLLLRDFRDEYLEKQKSGRIFINIYYKYSPFFARIIKRNRLLRKISYNFIVRPLAVISSRLLHR